MLMNQLIAKVTHSTSKYFTFSIKLVSVSAIPFIAAIVGSQTAVAQSANEFDGTRQISLKNQKIASNLDSSAPKCQDSLVYRVGQDMEQQKSCDRQSSILNSSQYLSSGNLDRSTAADAIATPVVLAANNTTALGATALSAKISMRSPQPFSQTEADFISKMVEGTAETSVMERAVEPIKVARVSDPALISDRDLSQFRSSPTQTNSQARIPQGYTVPNTPNLLPSNPTTTYNPSAPQPQLLTQSQYPPTQYPVGNALPTTQANIPQGYIAPNPLLSNPTTAPAYNPSAPQPQLLTQYQYPVGNALPTTQANIPQGYTAPNPLLSNPTTAPAYNPSAPQPQLLTQSQYPPAQYPPAQYPPAQYPPAQYPVGNPTTAAPAYDPSAPQPQYPLAQYPPAQYPVGNPLPTTQADVYRRNSLPNPLLNNPNPSAPQPQLPAQYPADNSQPNNAPSSPTSFSSTSSSDLLEQDSAVGSTILGFQGASVFDTDDTSARGTANCCLSS